MYSARASAYALPRALKSESPPMRPRILCSLSPCLILKFKDKIENLSILIFIGMDPYSG